MYHGIILNEEFVDPDFVKTFKFFAKRKSSTNSWILYGIEVKDSQLQEAVSQIQVNIKAGEPYYAHLYNDKEVVVIFKDKVFRVTPHESSWNKIKEFGRTLKIPEDQLDFWPNRFQDERHYFNPEDYIQ